MTSKTLYQVWDQILEHVGREHRELVRSWFLDLAPLELDQGTLRVRADNDAQLRYLRATCRAAFNSAGQAVTGRLITVSFEPSNADLTGDGGVMAGLGVQAPRSGRTFEDFVGGPCNRLALAAARSIVDEPAGPFNPLFIHGEFGLGKTHLLDALSGELARRHPERQVWSTHADAFVQAFVQAMETGREIEFRHRAASLDVFILDDIHLLQNRQRSQEALFGVVNPLLQSGRQVVVSSAHSLAALDGLTERLRSRLSAGLTALVERPCEETRAAILRHRCSAEGIAMDGALVDWLATMLNGTIGEMIEWVQRLDAVAQSRDGVITKALIEELLDVPAAGEPAIGAIIEAVARRFQIRVEDLQGAGRSRSLSRPRHVGMYLARELTNQSLERIGSFFGGRDHGTVRRAAVLVASRMQADVRLRKTVAELMEEIRSRRG